MRVLLCLLPSVLLLVACATAPKESPPTPTGPANIETKAEPAYASMASGDYAKAAARFRELTIDARPPRLQEYQVGAAEALINGDRLLEAGQALAEVQLRGITPRDGFRLSLLRGRLALKKRDAEAALVALTPPPSAVKGEHVLLAEFHLLRGLAFAQGNNPLESAHEYALRESYLTDPAIILGNQRAIIDALAQISEPLLLSLQRAPAPDAFSGWLELARIGKSRQSVDNLESLLINWHSRYPNHPAREEIFSALRERARELSAIPSRIALLLPLSGKLAGAASAVRDGVLAAYYASANRTSGSVRTYDIGSNPDSVVDTYDQAVQDGAQFVIGPLSKEEVEELAHRGDLKVPVLALNNLDSSSSPKGLYQFGLAPEEEARQVAERAWLDGHSNAAVIVPATPWGARIEQAFRERWTEMGGAVVTAANYNPQENDYAGPLKAMLDLDESIRRRREITRIVGRRLEFTPRRRQDVDFIFISAFPRQARLLRPQIKFHHADDLPVYATSHVFTGTIAPERDRDMNGAVFGDMPWVLEGLQPRALKRHEGQMARLVALGVDAFNVLRYLRLMESYPDERFEGNTGVLRLDEKRRVHRQLAWARFEAGRPRPLELEAVQPRAAVSAKE